MDLAFPAPNNILLATILLSLLAVAHSIAHKRNILHKNDTRNRLHVAWGIALTGLPAVLYPKSLGLVFWAIIPMLAWQEWITNVRIPHSTRTKAWWMGVGTYLVQLGCVLLLPPQHGWMAFFLPLLFALAAWTRRPLSRWISTGMVATMLLPALALPLLMHARLSVLIWCFVVPQLFDAFQYIVGRKWGRHPLSRASPKKTWEGLLGGGLAAWLCAMALSPWLPWNEWHTAYTTVLLLGASYLGGWLSSRLKRVLGLKDWGTRLGSHGGILDRMDSLIFSIPIAWTFYYWHLHT